MSFRLAPFAFAAAVGLSAAVAPADVVTAEYNLPETLPAGGMSLDYGFFGYEGPNGFESLVGHEVIASRFDATFTPDPGVDIQDLFIGFVVPVDPTLSGETFWAITGDMFTETVPGSGVYTLSLSTDDFNGPARPGRFSLEAHTLADPPTPIGGTFAPGSGFEFDVLRVPEPTSAMALAGAAGALGLRRRR